MSANKYFNKTAATTAPKQSKLKKWGKIIGLVLVAAFLILYYFPYYGTIKYGICRTYIELQEPYPASIQYINAVEDLTYTNTVTISYKKVDPFGLEALNEMQCFFQDTPEGAIVLTKVDINGKKRSYPQEDPEIVKEFNKTIPAIQAYPPSLIMPYLLSNDIKEYR